MVDLTSHPFSVRKNSNPQKTVKVFAREISALDFIIIGAMSFILLMQLYLQFTQRINWDEFFYLSHIYDGQKGRLDKTLQMGHVYLFSWLTAIPGGEMMQITVGRTVMWAAQIATISLIVKTAQKFMSFSSALFAGLSFLGLGFVFIHGTSFRADPVAALCMMYAVYVFTASDLRRAHLAGLSVALALGAFITIKVILFAPLLAVLAVMRLNTAKDKKSLFVRFTIAAALAIFLFPGSVFLHSLTLAVPENVDHTKSLGSTAETVFLSGGLFPRLAVMKVGFLTGLLPTIMIIFGAMAALWSVLMNKPNQGVALNVLAMALPLLCFVFYRNAYPYFYAFIFPSAAILAGYAIDRLKLPNLIIVALSVVTVLNLVVLGGSRKNQSRAVQAETIEAVHTIFSDPVHYFDRNGMIASFPKAGFFMSSWGLRNYRMGETPMFLQELNHKTIPLLIDNSPNINAALRGEESGLLAADAMVLRANYIQHWGHIWVAGKSLETSPEPLKFKILVPGTYSLKASNDVNINGAVYASGSQVDLPRGDYVISSQSPQNVILRWGVNLSRPDFDAIDAPIFGSF